MNLRNAILGFLVVCLTVNIFSESELKREQIFFGQGVEENLAVGPKESFGVYFHAKGTFDSLAVEIRPLTYWLCQPLLKLYGPFEKPDRPGSYKKKFILENRINLNRDLNRQWYQFNFKPQKLGYYFATLVNDRENTQFECYLKIESPNEDAVPFIKNKPVYWKDLNFSINSLRQSSSIKISSKDQKSGNFGDSGFYVRNLLTPDNQKLINNEIPLMRQLNIEGITSNLQSGSQVQQIKAFLENHNENLKLKLKIPVWNKLFYKLILEENNTSNLRRIKKGSIESLINDEFITQSKKFIKDLEVLFPDQTIELFDDINFPVMNKNSDFENCGVYLKDLFGDTLPNQDSNRDQVIFNSLFNQDYKSWGNAAKWIFQIKGIEKANFVKKFIERELFSLWLSEVLSDDSSLKFGLAVNDLNLIDQALFKLDHATLVDPSSAQIRIIKNFYHLNDKEIFIDQAFRDYQGPDRAEKLRWLICRNFNESINWNIGNWNHVRKAHSGRIRGNSLDLINRSIGSNKVGSLSRDINPVLELSTFPKLDKRKKSKILVVCSDLNTAPEFSFAEYISEVEFLKIESKSLNAFQAIIFVNSKISIGGDLFSSLNKFLKSGGVVFVSPEQYHNNSIIPFKIPEKHSELLTRVDQFPELKPKLLYHDPYENNKKWKADSEQHAVYIDKVFKVQNGMLGVGPFGGKADIWYNFPAPSTAEYLEVDLEYRAWGGQDWVRLYWGTQIDDRNDVDLPNERKKTNHWNRVFHVDGELTYENLFLQFTLVAYDRTRADNDLQGAALEDLKINYYEDPYSFKSRVEFENKVVVINDVLPYYTAEKPFKPVGQVLTRGNTKFPLAWEMKQGKGKWVYSNVKNLFSGNSLELNQFADHFLSGYLEDFVPENRRVKITSGENFLIAAKSNKIQKLEKYEIEFKTDIENPGVFDLLNRKWIEAEMDGDNLGFSISLSGKDAIGIYLIKPRTNPCLLFADGREYYPVSIDDGIYANSSLKFQFAEKAYVYSPQKPGRIVSGQKISSEYIPSSSLLILKGIGSLEEVKIEY